MSADPAQQPVDEEAVRGMVEHMNDDHADSVLLYVHHYGQRPEATAARLDHVDPEGMDITMTLPAGEERIRIPFDHTLENRHDAHMTMVKMSKSARRALG